MYPFQEVGILLRTMRTVALIAVVGSFGLVSSSRADEPAAFYANDAQLSSLMERLLDGNTEILAARSTVEAKRERVPQAKSLPDPTVSLRWFGSPPETRVGPQQQSLEFSQGVPWKNKRALQAQGAEYFAEGVAWRVRDLERVRVAELKKSYFEIAYLQEALRVNEEEKALLQRFEDTTLTRYATGQGIQQSVIKVQTEISRLQDQRTKLQAWMDGKTRKIAELIGRPGMTLDLTPISLGFASMELRASDLEEVAAESHPRVQAWLQQMEADRVRTKRRKLDTKPDFRFGVGYTAVGDREDTAGRLTPPEDNGQDIWAVMVGVNVPIYRHRIRAGVAEAQADLRASEMRLEQTRDRLRYEIQEAWLRMEASEERGHLYLDLIIPQAEESLASAEAAYTTNRMDFLDLLDAERILFQARLTSHRLLADYWIAIAELERGLGRSFPSGVNKP